MSDGPHRAHELICKIGADSKDGLIAEIENFARRIAMNDITNGVMGGYSSGAIYSYRHDPDMTHDRYFQELNAKLEADRAVEQKSGPDTERKRGSPPMVEIIQRGMKPCPLCGARVWHAV